MYGPVGVYWTGTKYYDTKYESDLWEERECTMDQKTDEANSDDSSRKVGLDMLSVV